MPNLPDFEKLGVFYLGRYTAAEGAPPGELVLYDSKDLVTHAVCVGMTGSGKTGLCLALLEEAAIDGIPALVIDPKGDLADLLLTFPNLAADDFRPWVNEDEARRQGMTADAFAEHEATRWKDGLAQWGQDGARIARLREAVDLAIYTPGSTAGLPLSVLQTLEAPAEGVREDAELLRERIGSTVSGLLGLLGVQADPLQSREHILISKICERAWSQGENLDLGALVHAIEQPPLERIGVVDLEAFFPAKERFALAMRLNNLLASPGFETWLEGQPLDVGQLLYTPEGKPRVAIVSISHLDDQQRMFVVSMVLNQLQSWVRSQAGTTSLRALFYMDEIAGYFPPVANPPSKQPLLSLLKQARAFGLGVVLATQNPVDLDYKGLSNCGTWFIGRLQTDRDRLRVIDALEGAAAAQSAGFERGDLERMIAALANRRFLLHNVHDEAPALFDVRWVMSYLRGPLTRAQIKTLMSARQVATAESGAGATTASEKPKPTARSTHSASVGEGARPALGPEVPQCFLVDAGISSEQTVYEPRLLATASVSYADRKRGIEHTETIAGVIDLGEGDSPDWSQLEPLDNSEPEFQSAPVSGAKFSAVPRALAQGKNYAAWKKAWTDYLARTAELSLLRSVELETVAEVGESERDFRVRLLHGAREERDRRTESLRAKYAPKLAAMDEKIRRAQQAIEREAEQASREKWQSVVNVGSTILSAVLGRKKISATTISRAGTAARGVGRAQKEQQDVARAGENLATLQTQREELDAQFQADVDQLARTLDPLSQPLERLVLKPKKTQIAVERLALVWVPRRG
jgi:hypothetical protein